MQPYNATIQSTNIYPGDFTQLQAFVVYDCGDGNPITKSYAYPVGSDPLDQINIDLTNLNAAQTANSTAVQDIQTALDTAIALPEAAQILSSIGVGVKTVMPDTLDSSSVV